MEYTSPIKLFLPPGWSSITPEQKAAAYNGVGSEAFPAWLRRLLDFIFHWAFDAVRIHDVEYAYGRSRVRADIRFLLNCLALSGWVFARVSLSFVAYFSVALFGRRAWKEGHKN